VVPQTAPPPHQPYIANTTTDQTSLANISSNYLIANTEASRWGTAHPSIVPYQVFRTADGYIMLAAGNDSQFRTLCSAAILNQPYWAQDEKFATNSARVKHRDEVVRMIEEVLGRKGTGEWCEVLTGKGYVDSLCCVLYESSGGWSLRVRAEEVLLMVIAVAFRTEPACQGRVWSDVAMS
jgi:hypothetical protein